MPTAISHKLLGLATVTRAVWDDVLWDDEEETLLSWTKVYVGGVKVRQYAAIGGRVGSVPAAGRAWSPTRGRADEHAQSSGHHSDQQRTASRRFRAGRTPEFASPAKRNHNYPG
jgi:hypothetical protein